MWLAYLLAGELLHEEEAWQSSNRYFQRAAALLEKSKIEDEDSPEIPAPLQLTPRQYQSLALGVQRTIGINAYHQKDYEIAAEVFSGIAKNEALSFGTTLKADEWRQRCQWAQQMHRQDTVSP
jgi:hypothetical protein